MNNQLKISAIIPAAGIGKRLGVGYNKQYIDLLGKPMVVRTMEIISKQPLVQEVILVVGQQEVEEAQAMVKQYHLHKVTSVIGGGKERVYSVINGYQHAKKDADYILIHDGARPLITEDEVRRCIEEAVNTGAAIVAVPVKDTIKIVDTEKQLIQSTPNRQTLWAAQTPQIIRNDWFGQAIIAMQETNEFDRITDDSMLIELLGKPVAIVQGNYENIKVTTPEDVTFAEMIMMRRQQQG